MSTGNTQCLRCGQPKRPEAFDCDDCSAKIAKDVGKRGKRTEDGPSHDVNEKRRRQP